MNPKNHYIFSVLIIFLAVLIGRLFVYAPTNASIIWPATGLIYGILVTYHKRMVPSMFLGLFLGIFYDYWLLSNFPIGLSIVISLVLSGMIVALVCCSVWVAYRFELTAKLTFKNVFSFISIALIISLCTSSIGQSIQALFGLIEWSDYFKGVWIWLLGDFTGFIVFGGIITIAMGVDEKPFFDHMKQNEFVFYGLFTLFCFMIFSGQISYITYDTHKFLFLPFVLWIAFSLPYRTFYISLLLFLFFMSLLYTGSYANYWGYLINVNGFLMVSFLIFSVLKDFLVNLKNNELDYEKKRFRLNKTIRATHALMNLSSDYLSIGAYDEVREAKKMFRTVAQLITKSDCGSCIVVSEGHVTYIDVYGGYDIDSLNSIEFNIDVWKAKLDKPLLTKNAEARLIKLLGSNYNSFREKNPMVKESVFMSVRLSETFAIEMSFDISVDNHEHYESSDMIFFDSLHLILNSFYQSYVLSKENDLLKNQILESLLKTIELYDKDMYQHSMNVAKVAVTIGEQMGMDGESKNDLYWAGIVHDIGKIAVPPSILKNPNTLSKEDYDIVKTHSEIGFKSLNESEALQKISLLVKHHHERYDGQGYPEGLRANQISIQAYILGMAEAVVSMATTQVYSQAKSMNTIRSILFQESAKQFEPNVVIATLTCINNGSIENIINHN